MTTPAVDIGNVRDLLLRKWGVPTIPRESTLVLGLTQSVIAKQDPQRVALMILNTGTSPVHVNPTVSSAGPFFARIEPSGGSLFVFWEEDGEVSAYEWQGNAIGAAGQIHVWEVILVRSKIT